MKILVTTNLKETLGRDEEILFAGDWVKYSLNFDSDFKNRKYNFFDSIWENQNKLTEFHPYLTELRNKLIKQLSSNLNTIHNTIYSEKFWRIIINPWLHYYLEGMYTRWETINKILDKKENLNFVYLNSLKNLEAPFDVRDYYSYITSSDIYNQYIFQKIINYFVNVKNNEYLKIVYSNEKLSKKENFDFLKKNEKQNYIRKFISLILRKATNNNKFFLELNSLGIYFIYLNFMLKQIPFKDYEFFTFQSYNELFESKKISNVKLRENLIFEFNEKNDFENFLKKNFVFDIPISLIEDFFSIQNYVEKIPYKPKIIVSDSKHEHDTIFKFWLASNVDNGSKLVTTDHGASYGSATHDLFVHEEMSDVAIRWHKPIMNNNVQLPVLYLLKKKRDYKNKKKHILTIGFDGTKYPRYVFINPIAGQLLYQVKYLSNFYKNLNLELQNNFLFRPYPDYTYDGGWNFDKRLEKIFHKEKIISSTKQFLNVYSKSKIVVCTYPKTAFSEAMISGPTILLYKSKYFRNNSKEFDNINEELRNAKILFEDPILASKHLNEIWKNVDDWWESKNVKKARENFFIETALVESKPLEKWKNFLQKF